MVAILNLAGSKSYRYSIVDIHSVSIFREFHSNSSSGSWDVFLVVQTVVGNEMQVKLLLLLFFFLVLAVEDLLSVLWGWSGTVGSGRHDIGSNLCLGVVFTSSSTSRLCKLQKSLCQTK